MLGDLNEGPPTGGTQAVNLASLYDNNTSLVDCYSLPNFDVGNRPGHSMRPDCATGWTTFSSPGAYSPSYRGGGLFRRGVWGSRVTRPTNWDTYPEMERVRPSGVRPRGGVRGPGYLSFRS